MIQCFYFLRQSLPKVLRQDEHIQLFLSIHSKRPNLPHPTRYNVEEMCPHVASTYHTYFQHCYGGRGGSVGSLVSYLTLFSHLSQHFWQGLSEKGMLKIVTDAYPYDTIVCSFYIFCFVVATESIVRFPCNVID